MFNDSQPDAQGGLQSASSGVLKYDPVGATRGLLLGVVFILLIAAVGSACSSRPVISGPAPDFSLDSLNGGSIALSDLEGQVVILDFWATWCTPCVESMNHLQQLHDQYAGQGLIVLAINVGETRGRIAAFVADHGYTFTVLLDTDERVTDAYGVRGIPHTLVVDQDGKISHISFGPHDIENAVHRLLEE